MARYNYNNIEYVSVTEVLDIIDKSSALIPWGIGCALEYVRLHKTDSMNDAEFEQLLKDAKYKYREVSTEAKDIGSQVHDLIENYIKFGLDKSKHNEYPEEVENGFLAFLEWSETNHIKWLRSELQIIDTELCYAGTLDAVCEINGIVTVIDFKSSKGFYETYPMQISAYLKAYNKQRADTEPEATACGILRLDKETGLPEYKDYTDNMENNYKAFCYLLDYFYVAKKRRLKNNPRI